jgi:hypothetical protein
MALNFGNSTTKYPKFPESRKLAGSKQIAEGNTDRLSLRLSRFTNLCSLPDGGIAANRLNPSGRDTAIMVLAGSIGVACAVL